METPRALLSDLDGTLINTLHLIRHGLYQTSKNYFEQTGIPAADLPDYENYAAVANQAVGGSPRNTVETAARLLYAHHPQHLARLDFDELYAGLDTVQDVLAPEFVKPYAGLSETLHYLGANSIQLAIITSGTPHHVVRNIGAALPELGLVELSQQRDLGDNTKLETMRAVMQSHYNLADFTIITCEDTAEHKPNPEAFNLALQRLGRNPSEVAILGDHKGDMLAGLNAGIPQRIGITHGFDDAALLQSAGATDIIDSLHDIKDRF